MRDFIVLGMVLALASIAVVHPYIGVLAWTWVSVMNPHRLTWSFAFDFPVAMVIALATIIGTAISRDRPRLALNPPVMCLILFMLWMCVTSLAAIYPQEIGEMFSKVMKILFMVLVATAVLKTRKHLELLVWVLVISLGFYGVKGGIFTIFTGGAFRVWGPAGSFIEGNNEVALALIVTIPLMRYLQLVSTHRMIRASLGVAMALTALAALGSQSRGALLAIVAMAALFCLRSDRKMVMVILLVALSAGIVAFLPDSWEARMRTIEIETADTSILGRFNAWSMAWNLAVDRPIGGGFEVITPELFARYAPNPFAVHAAHSIYFQVLGEHGFPGLLLFLLIWWFVWRWAGRLHKNGDVGPDLEWTRHLGGMIQVSLIGYLVGGAFLSLAYFDLPYNLLILVVVARQVLDARLGDAARRSEESAGHSSARRGFA